MVWYCSISDKKKKKNASQSRGNLASLIPLYRWPGRRPAPGEGQWGWPHQLHVSSGPREEGDLKTGHRDAKDAMAPATVLTDNEFLLQAFGHSRASYRLLRHWVKDKKVPWSSGLCKEKLQKQTSPQTRTVCTTLEQNGTLARHEAMKLFESFTNLR